MLDYPALTGGVVTEVHTRTCAERGHASHTVAGVDSGVCPRCGEQTASADGCGPSCRVYGPHAHKDGWVLDRLGWVTRDLTA